MGKNNRLNLKQLDQVRKLLEANLQFLAEKGVSIPQAAQFCNKELDFFSTDRNVRYVVESFEIDWGYKRAKRKRVTVQDIELINRKLDFLFEHFSLEFQEPGDE